MSETPSSNTDFLTRVTQVIKEHLSNERFGVSELAEAMHMSRSSLLRKIRQTTPSSVSQLIREIRLQRGMELLSQTSLGVSEISYQVGFSSTSYFIKCFRERYGYPPGEAGKRQQGETPIVANATEDKQVTTKPSPAWNKKSLFWGGAVLLALLLVPLLIYLVRKQKAEIPQEKSIVMLPLENDSNDSSNGYFINGLMEATLNNLQKIKDLRVLSRTSAEKYRHTQKSISELASELNVRYLIEGSGQKIGDRILLHIQLIDAQQDKHMWSKQYEREVTDVFQLQQEIAKDIAHKIQATITWEEDQRIRKIPTKDLEAYDDALKAAELMRIGGNDHFEQAIRYLKEAIQRDPDFASAYALIAISYYYLDTYQAQKQYKEEIGQYADKALQRDSSLTECLFAKALYYVHQQSYPLALPYLEKALAYSPNSAMVIHFLADFYNSYEPNTAKYLEYALLGMRLDVTAEDSVTTSYNYLHLANALVQTGFVDESLFYINKSLAYFPDNPFAGWVKAVIVYAKTRDAAKLEKLLLADLAKDTTRLPTLQELGTLYYRMDEKEKAYTYLQRFLQLREKQQLDIFQMADLSIGALWTEMGKKKEGQAFMARVKAFAEKDKSIYKHLLLAMYDAYNHDEKQMIAHLQLFSKEKNYQYWVLLFKEDPKVAPFKHSPAFREVMGRIEKKFWDEHQEIRKTLVEKGLLQ